MNRKEKSNMGGWGNGLANIYKYSIRIFVLLAIIQLIYIVYNTEYSKEAFVVLLCLPFVRCVVIPEIFGKYGTGPMEADFSFALLIIGLGILLTSELSSNLQKTALESKVIHYNLEDKSVKRISDFTVNNLGAGKEFSQEFKSAGVVFSPVKESNVFLNSTFKNLFIFNIEHRDVQYVAACFTKSLDNLEDRHCYIK